VTTMDRASLSLGAAVVFSMVSNAVAAQEASRPSLETLRRNILTQTPQTKVEKVDQERLVVRRIDVVDENGVIRMTLAAPTPPPIVDGIQYRRAFPVAGLTIFDKFGAERGGYGVADIEGSAVVAAQDHINADAIGWRIMPDGSVDFVINERPAIVREPGLGNRIIPGVKSATRIKMSVTANGAPSIALADKQDRPRLRLIVTEEGFGAIEFLNADGKVIETFAPEARKGVP
jgi:hypothetical protein